MSCEDIQITASVSEDVSRISSGNFAKCMLNPDKCVQDGTITAIEAYEIKQQVSVTNSNESSEVKFEAYGSCSSCGGRSFN
jgi:hypothetical protein